MLISLIGLLVMSLITGIRKLAEAPIVIEGPSTLELALIGGGVIIVYAVTSRVIGRRRVRIDPAHTPELLTHSERTPMTADNTPPETTSRGAA